MHKEKKERNLCDFFPSFCGITVFGFDLIFFLHKFPHKIWSTCHFTVVTVLHISCEEIKAFEIHTEWQNSYFLKTLHSITEKDLLMC